MGLIGHSHRSLAGTKRQSMERQAANGRFGRARAPFSAAGPQGPVPGVVVSAVLHFADERDELDGGQIALRLSAGRLRDLDLAAALGPHVDRAAGVCVVWDVRECQITAVVEDECDLRALLARDEDDALWAQATGGRERQWSAAA